MFKFLEYSNFIKLLKGVTKKRVLMLGFASLLAIALVLSGVTVGEKSILQKGSSFEIGIGQKVITIGHIAYAAGTADFTCDGVIDDVQFQSALDALPANGGKISVLTGNYVFSATVTRAIPNVVIEGNGLSTNFTYDGVNPIFTAGGNYWAFRNFATDAGGINIGATSGWVQENVLLGASYYAYRTASDVGASSWDIPVGRVATYVVAASNAPSHVKAQADYVCDNIGNNDNVEIQAAIDALRNSGGSIQLTKGDYYISSPLNPYFSAGTSFGVLIFGQGLNNTVLRQAGNINVIEQLNGAGESLFVGFFDLRILGDDAYTGSAVYVTETTQAKDWRFDRVFIENFSDYGIYTKMGWGWKITNSVIELVDTAAIHIQSTNDGPLIQGNKIISNAGDAIVLNNAAGTRIVNNELNANGSAIKLWIQTEAGAPTTIVGNWIRDSGQGIYLRENIWYVTIVGNSFDGNTVGLYFRSTGAAGHREVLVEGNNFLSNNTAAVTYLGPGSGVSGNMIQNNLGYIAPLGSTLYADHTWSGSITSMTAGTNLALGDICYIGSDSKLEKILATSNTTMPAICIVTGVISENSTGCVLLSGFFRDDTWNWTAGGFLYADNVTSGGMTQQMPSGSGDQVQIVAIAVTADIIYFNPDLTIVEIP